jgi:tetratricopeptide (TPR) repeat protein
MCAKRISFSRLVNFSILFLVAGWGIVRAQNDSPEDIKYSDDYERIQKINASAQPLKRADQLVVLLKERPDLDTKLYAYVANIFVRDLEALSKQKNFIAIRDLSERAVKARPKFGEAYVFYGLSLRQENRLDEAIQAFAKCFLIPNPYQQRAKQQLDMVYRAKNGGSLVGEDKVIEAAKKELK